MASDFHGTKLFLEREIFSTTSSARSCLYRTAAGGGFVRTSDGLSIRREDTLTRPTSMRTLSSHSTFPPPMRELHVPPCGLGQYTRRSLKFFAAAPSSGPTFFRAKTFFLPRFAPFLLKLRAVKTVVEAKSEKNIAAEHSRCGFCVFIYFSHIMYSRAKDKQQR